ncbi:MAG TPA: SH3 domain-containing protein [Vicinamibacterales bacterium]|nr:SH3 domain-containing protein [Vicinamibacterales bacterium]
MCVRRLSFAFLSPLLVTFVHSTASAQTLITTSSSVRLRAAAAADARVVAELPLGTEVSACGAVTNGWREVETAAGIRGWIHGGLVEDLAPPSRVDTIERLIRKRLSRKADPPAARLELAALVERVMSEAATPQQKARMELARLRAVGGVIEALPVGARPGEPFDAWIDAHQALIEYHHVTGRYILRTDAVLKAHARHERSAATVAEELMWLAVTNGFAGECEGILRCYIGRTDATEGDYLRAYPEGRHVDAVIRRLQDRANWWLSRMTPVYGFEAALQCGELSPMIENLKFAVATASHPDRNGTIARLDEVARRCR